MVKHDRPKLQRWMSDSEYRVFRDTKKSRLVDLSEDRLIDLHRRVRRLRTKYTKLYRRSGAGAVANERSRGAGRKSNARNARKAEAFETALARVSEHLAAEARRTAQSLRAERLNRAQQPSPPFTGDAADVPAPHHEGRAPHRDRVRDSSGRKKYEASVIAEGSRNQAARDNRPS